jgi:hypothetical protein
MAQRIQRGAGVAAGLVAKKDVHSVCAEVDVVDSDESRLILRSTVIGASPPSLIISS